MGVAHMTTAQRTLKIEKQKCGYRPLEIGKEEKQRLTINSNGRVWFTSYGIATDDAWKYIALRKMRLKLDPKQANAIIEKALTTILQDTRIQDEVFVMECDTEPDIICVVDKKGGYWAKRVLERIVPAVDELYDAIQKAIHIEWLLEFDYEFNTE